ncbi:MAG: GNAT family N-acetyltransferase [Armatimonadota bacterium]
MKIEQLSVENLREGIYCPRGRPRSEEVYVQLEAWLDGAVLRGQVARSDSGEPIGFILYYRIEDMPMEVDGSGLYMLQCLYVKPESQGQGVGRALVEAAVSDVLGCGAEGIAAEAHHQAPTDREDYLPGSFYQHIGMTPGQTRGTATLYFMALRESACPPRYIDPRYQPPRDPTRIRIDILDCRRCYTAVRNRDVVRQVAESFKDDVSVVVHDQNSRAAVLDKGMSTGVFIDGKLTFFQGPISEEDVWHAIRTAASARKTRTDR